MRIEEYDEDTCPFCKRTYDWYCHQGCKKTKELIDTLKDSYFHYKSAYISSDDLKFIIDALEGLYEGGDL